MAVVRIPGGRRVRSTQKRPLASCRRASSSAGKRTITSRTTCRRKIAQRLRVSLCVPERGPPPSGGRNVMTPARRPFEWASAFPLAAVDTPGLASENKRRSMRVIAAAGCVTAGKGRIAMPGTDTDIIDTLAGIKPGSALDEIRNRRPQARDQAQASYRALFAPEDFGGVTATERLAVAAFATGLHGGAETASFYAAGLAASGASPELRRAIDTAIAAAKGKGPYGSYPAGPLSRE